nr:zinc finger BED domain-containing protein DAYSLEEPER-like [Ipomoea batatas]
MAMNMKLKFDKYWDDYSVILAIGVILDQRLKLQFVEYCYKKLNPLTCQVKIEGIKKKLYMLYDEYKKTSGDSSSSRVSTPQSQVYSATSSVGVGRGGMGSMGGPGILYQNFISDYVDYRYRSQGESSSGDTKSNLDKYLEDDQLNQLDDIDVRLAKMACDVLSIPITSVASESAFSIGAHILNKYRNRLLPKKVQALICTPEGQGEAQIPAWPPRQREPAVAEGRKTKATVCLGIQFIIRSPLRHASSLPSSTLSNAQASPQQYDQTCNACRFYGIYMCFFKPTVDLKLGHGGSHSGYWDIVYIVSRKISAKFTSPKSLLWSISNFPSSLQASTSENLNRRVSRSFSGRSSISEHVCNAGLASLSTEPKLKPATGLSAMALVIIYINLSMGPIMVEEQSMKNPITSLSYTHVGTEFNARRSATARISAISSCRLLNIMIEQILCITSRACDRSSIPGQL